MLSIVMVFLMYASRNALFHEQIQTAPIYIYFKSSANNENSVNKVLCKRVIAKKESKELAEVNRHFTYHGAAIHPRLLGKFLGLISDNTPPVTVSVDIIAASQAGNEFYQWPVKQCEKDVWSTHNNDTDESYSYRWIGRLKNGIHVVLLSYSSGGSSIFKSLFLITFSDSSILWEDRQIKQLLMSIVGIYSLEDRNNSNINIEGNTIIISALKPNNPSELF
jgi:hypothetical protein